MALMPDRTDLPFVAIPGLAEGRVEAASFARSWGPEFMAWRALAEFALLKWQDDVAAVAAPDLTKLDVEIKALVQAAQDERADALGEILAESGDFLGRFTALLTMTRGSHPATYRLLHIGGLFGMFVVMPAKARFHRPRPSQVCPALMPPIPVPGHAAYPSGHATQSRLIARLLGAVLPDADQRKAVDALADRIARNREIAGVHYKSDTTAGEALGDAIFARAHGHGLVATTIAAAQAEWAAV